MQAGLIAGTLHGLQIRSPIVTHSAARRAPAGASPDGVWRLRCVALDQEARHPREHPIRRGRAGKVETSCPCSRRSATQSATRPCWSTSRARPTVMSRRSSGSQLRSSDRRNLGTPMLTYQRIRSIHLARIAVGGRGCPNRGQPRPQAIALRAPNPHRARMRDRGVRSRASLSVVSATGSFRSFRSGRARCLAGRMPGPCPCATTALGPSIAVFTFDAPF